MHIIDYKYIQATERFTGVIQIPELDRNKSAVNQFINLAGLNIELTRPTTFIFVDGTTASQSEAGIGQGTGKYSPAIKSGSTYAAHQWCSTFINNEHLVSMHTVAGTCASGIQALYLAQDMIYNAFNTTQEVIIIGHERITKDTMRLFRELGINVTCGDGFVYMRLGPGFDITNVQWKWEYNENPFMFTRKTLDTLIPGYRIGYVKLHGTGTESNEAAEQGLAELATPLSYKEKIGHTQGISALLETCLILDNPNIRGRILVTANGLGGYYGAFTLTKPNARDF